jgi:hypothetical protein
MTAERRHRYAVNRKRRAAQRAELPSSPLAAVNPEFADQPKKPRVDPS